MNRSYEEKLEIAKLVYREIMEVINRWENDPDFEIGCCWDECISIDDELFHGHELRK